MPINESNTSAVITGDGLTSQKPTTGLFTPERKAVDVSGGSFKDPDPGSKMINPVWEKATRG
jgi:hypothetical protein